MFYEDLAPCTYPYLERAKGTLAVGWLEAGLQFPTGPIKQKFRDALRRVLRDPWGMVDMMGIHQCEFCGRVAGTGELFIPANEGVYVAPVLVDHYVDVHHYRPPDGFIAAVTRCPTMGGDEYLRGIRRHFDPDEVLKRLRGA